MPVTQEGQDMMAVVCDVHVRGGYARTAANARVKLQDSGVRVGVDRCGVAGGGADEELERAHQQKWAAEREREQRRLAAQEAERRRLEEEQRKAEQACRNRLAALAEDWQVAGSVRLFLTEVRHHLAEQSLGPEDSDLMERWLRWADRVADDRDPFSQAVGELPERTNPGIKERERSARAAQVSETQRPTDGA